MANLKQTSITGSSGTTTLLVSGSSIVMPSMSGSVDSGSAAQMYVDITPTAGLTMKFCLLYTSPSPRDRQKSRMPSSA